MYAGAIRVGSSLKNGFSTSFLCFFGPFVGALRRSRFGQTVALETSFRIPKDRPNPANGGPTRGKERVSKNRISINSFFACCISAYSECRVSGDGAIFQEEKGGTTPKKVKAFWKMSGPFLAVFGPPRAPGWPKTDSPACPY